jgi:hypothetical protein
MDENWYGEVRITADNATFYFDEYFINGLNNRDGMTITGSGVLVNGYWAHEIRYCNNGIVVYGKKVTIRWVQAVDFIRSYGVFAYQAHTLKIVESMLTSVYGTGLCAYISDNIILQETTVIIVVQMEYILVLVPTQ